MGKTYTRRNVMVGAGATAAVSSLRPTSLHAADAVTHDVRIKSFAFVPARLEVSLGDIIRWTNEDLAPHTATADEFGWDTEKLNQGEQAKIVVTKGMETTYFCSFHPHMKGTLVIS